MRAHEIAGKASELVGGDRANTHGDKLKNFSDIAAIWNGILTAAGKRPNIELNALDVANMMEGMKIARRYSGSHNVDDYVDGAGYAACAGEIAERQEQITKSWSEAA
jgi:hypothetical protein